MSMTPSEFMSAQYGGVIKPAAAYTEQKIEGIAPNAAAGLTISVLKNKDGADVKTKYVGTETIMSPNFIRADQEDGYFTEVTTGASAMFIYSK